MARANERCRLIAMSRWSEEQIIGVLREAEGAGRSEGPRALPGARDPQDTFYRWRRKYGGMEVSDARRKLRKVVAVPYLDKEALKDALSRKW